MWGAHPSRTLEERAIQSLTVSKDENEKKIKGGESKMIRALAFSENELTCLVTPRTTYSGEVEVEWNGNSKTRLKGVLGVEAGSASQHLKLQISSDFYVALRRVATHGPIPIKLFCNHSSSMMDIERAMWKGLETSNTLLGHLFSSEDSLYPSEYELPPNLREGNAYQLEAYQMLQKHRVALVQGLPGSGKTRLMLNILKQCRHLKATWMAETNDTCEMLAYKAKRAGLSPVILLAKGRGAPKNMELHHNTVDSVAKEYNCNPIKVIASANLLILTNTLATTHKYVSTLRHSNIVLIDEAGMIPAYRFAGLRILLTSHLLICGDPMQSPPYKEQRGEFAHLLQTHARMKIVLSEQFRMPPTISRLSNALAYGGEMRDGNNQPPPLPSSLPAFLGLRLILIDTGALQSPHHTVGGSSVNNTHIEASLALYRILRKSYPLQSIQALSLYEAHASELATARLPCFSDAPQPLSIAQAQGSEFPVVILNIVKTGNCRGFPENLNLINVAVSRAQSQMFIIADAQGLLQIQMWKDLKSLWLESDTPSLVKNANWGKKRVTVGKLMQTALSPPYVYWNGSKDSDDGT